MLDAQHRERERTVARLARHPQVDGERGPAASRLRRGPGARRARRARPAAVPDSARRDEKRAWMRANAAGAAKSRCASGSTSRRATSRCAAVGPSERTHIRVRRVDASRIATLSTQWRSTCRATPACHEIPRAAIVVAVAAGEVRAFRAEEGRCRRGVDGSCRHRSRSARPSPQATADWGRDAPTSPAVRSCSSREVLVSR